MPPDRPAGAPTIPAPAATSPTPAPDDSQHRSMPVWCHPGMPTGSPIRPAWLSVHSSVEPLRIAKVGRQHRLQTGDTFVQLFFGIGLRWQLAPYWRRPCRIVPIADNMMNMQLTDHIAQRRDIDLVCSETIFQGLGQPAGFVQQLNPICLIQLEYFGDILPAWHQNEPWELMVIHQQKST